MTIALPGYFKHEIYQGTDYKVSLVLANANGFAENLTGSNVISIISTVDGAIVGDFLITVTDAIRGKIDVEYPATFPLLPPGRYLHNLIVQSNSSIKPWLAGDVISYRNQAVGDRILADANAVKIGGFPVQSGVPLNGYILKFDSIAQRWVYSPDLSGGGPGGGGPTYAFAAPLSESGGVVAIAPATTSAAGTMSAADKVKLNGIATGATANATNAQLRDRATHTGTQPISSIAGLQAALDAIQGLDPDLQAIAGLTTTGFILRTGNGAATARSLTVSDIPSLPASIIGSGVFADAQIPTSIARDSEVTAAIAAITATDVGAQPQSARLSEIAALTPSVGQVIKWNGSAWFAGTDNTGGTGGSSYSFSPPLSEAAGVVTLTLAPSDIPNIPASKITSGTIADSQIPASIARDSEVEAAIASAVAGLSDVSVISVTASRDLTADDIGCVLRCTSTVPIVLTIPAGIATAGKSIVVCRSGVGEVSFEPVDEGLSLLYSEAFYVPAIAAIHAGATLFFWNENECWLSGALKPVATDRPALRFSVPSNSQYLAVI